MLPHAVSRPAALAEDVDAGISGSATTGGVAVAVHLADVVGWRRAAPLPVALDDGIYPTPPGGSPLTTGGKPGAAALVSIVKGTAGRRRELVSSIVCVRRRLPLAGHVFGGTGAPRRELSSVVIVCVRRVFPLGRGHVVRGLSVLLHYDGRGGRSSGRVRNSCPQEPKAGLELPGVPRLPQ